jgi:hypothetical protein
VTLANPVGRHAAPLAVPTGPLTRHGGPVETGPTVNYLILWQPAGVSFPSNFAQQLSQFFADLGGSSLYGMSGEYTDGAGHHPVDSMTLGGVWVDTTPYPSSSDSAFVGSVANHQRLTHGAATNINTNYFVFTAGGYTAPSGVCGYHYSNKTPTGPMQVAWIGLGSKSRGCAFTGTNPNGVATDGSISVASHELLEMVTDPTGGGWFAGNGAGEIGDKCVWRAGSRSSDGSNLTINGHTYLVQQEWSNTKYSSNKTTYGGCALTPPTSQPWIYSAFLPVAPVGSSYSYKVKGVGASPLTWSLAAGNLPTGIHLGTNGVLSGIATAASVSPISIKVVHGTSSAIHSYTLTTSLIPTVTVNPDTIYAWNQSVCSFTPNFPISFSWTVTNFKPNEHLSPSLGGLGWIGDDPTTSPDGSFATSYTVGGYPSGNYDFDVLGDQGDEASTPMSLGYSDCYWHTTGSTVTFSPWGGAGWDPNTSVTLSLTGTTTSTGTVSTDEGGSFVGTPVSVQCPQSGQVAYKFDGTVGGGDGYTSGTITCTPAAAATLPTTGATPSHGQDDGRRP